LILLNKTNIILQNNYKLITIVQKSNIIVIEETKEY